MLRRFFFLWVEWRNDKDDLFPLGIEDIIDEKN